MERDHRGSESTRPTAEPTSRSVVSHRAQVESVFKPARDLLRGLHLDISVEASRLPTNNGNSPTGIEPLVVRYSAPDAATLRGFEQVVGQFKREQRLIGHKRALGDQVQEMGSRIDGLVHHQPVRQAPQRRGV